MNHPLFQLLLTLAAVYVARLWWDDRRAAEAGRPNRGALPGATRAPLSASVIAAIGALVLLAGETIGESMLGISAEQSRMTWLFALCSIVAAPVIEELIFRGWLVVDRHGAALRWLGAIAASIGFALLHPFLWRWEDGAFSLNLGVKSLFSTGVVFLMSLWLYVARFAAWNPRQSLLPCFVGHAAKNIGVVVIKASTGFMGGIV